MEELWPQVLVLVMEEWILLGYFVHQGKHRSAEAQQPSFISTASPCILCKSSINAVYVDKHHITLYLPDKSNVWTQILWQVWKKWRRVDQAALKTDLELSEQWPDKSALTTSAGEADLAQHSAHGGWLYAIHQISIHQHLHEMAMLLFWGRSAGREFPRKHPLEPLDPRPKLETSSLH